VIGLINDDALKAIDREETNASLSPVWIAFKTLKSMKTKFRHIQKTQSVMTNKE
jgi:hypothetical protein